MRVRRLPRFEKSPRSGVSLAALLAAAMLAAGHSGALAQSAGERDADRFAVPTVDPETAGPMSGFRRQIDPDSDRDPFAGDRDAERDRRRQGEAEGEDGFLDPLRDEAERDGGEEDRAGRDPFLPDDPDDGTDPADNLRSEEEARERRTAAQAAESLAGPYDPVGVRIGSFVLFPELTTGMEFTDNALITADDRQSDNAYFLTPRLKAQSNWSRHYFEADLAAATSYYSEFDIQDDRDYDINLLGRLDVTRRTQVEATALSARTLEDIDSVSAVAGAAERTPIVTSGGATRIRHRFNRLTASLRGAITEYDYEDVPLVEGGIANNDDRDYTERRLAGRLAYELRPGFSTFVEGGGNTRDYRFRIDDDGIVRGSRGHEALAGVAIDLTSKLRGEMAAGYAVQTPDETAFDDIDGFIFNAALEWKPTALTSVEFRAGSNIQETTLTDSPGSLLRNAELSVEHAFRQNLIAGVSLGYAEEDYEGIDQTDRDYILGLNGEYLLNRSMALVASYEHVKSTSTAPDDDTTNENIVRLGMRLRR